MIEFSFVAKEIRLWRDLPKTVYCPLLRIAGQEFVTSHSFDDPAIAERRAQIDSERLEIGLRRLFADDGYKLVNK